MNCPEHLIFNAKWLQIWHHQRADVQREYVTWIEVLNPLRYEICFGAGPGRYCHINEDAWLNMRLSNLTWKLWRKRQFKKRYNIK